MAALRALLTEIVDDAGLFPPASLDMADAVDVHLTARAGEFAWMLGRFVCPATQLDLLRRSLPRDAFQLRLSIITPTFERHGLTDERWRVEALEARLPDADVTQWAAELAGSVNAVGAARGWLEIPWTDYPSDRWTEAASIVASHDRLGLKVRCGGDQAEAVPPPGVLASIVVSSRDAGIAFKATAGLHHPYRHGGHHGFVNIAVAAVLALTHKLDAPDVAQIISEDDVDAFVLDDARVAWRDLAATTDEVIRARSGLFAGFGSCSFREPVDDLVALGILSLAS